MGAASARPHLRGLILVLGVLLVAGLAVAGGHGGRALDAAEAGETPAIGATYEPEVLGIPYGIWMPATWEQTSADGGFNNDVVATAPRTVYTTGDKWNGDVRWTCTSPSTWTARWPGSASTTAPPTAPMRARRSRPAARPSTPPAPAPRCAATGPPAHPLGLGRQARLDARLRLRLSPERLATDVAVDSDGNVTVIGWSFGRPGGSGLGRRELQARRHAPLGAALRRPAHLDDTPHKMLIDSAGSVYVAGRAIPAKNGCDAFIAKYAKTGTRLWAKRYNGSANGTDQASSLRARPGGGVYVAGHTEC
jgi:hypothetical protein